MENEPTLENLVDRVKELEDFTDQMWMFLKDQMELNKGNVKLISMMAKEISELKKGSSHE